MSGAPRVERVFEGRVFSVDVHRSIDVDGRPVTKEIVRHPGAVLIVPVLDDGRLVLIRNYRVAPSEELWEFPAGKLERGEDPRDAAVRELIEETGYEASDVLPLAQFYTSPGFADELMHVFVATGLRFVGQRLEPGEHIQVHLLDVSHALGLADRGEFRDGKTLAALLMWHRQQCTMADSADARAVRALHHP